MNDYKEVVDHVEMPERAGELRVKEQPHRAPSSSKSGTLSTSTGFTS